MSEVIETVFFEGRMREVVRIKSDKHPAGYYTDYRDRMKPGQEIFDPEKDAPAEEPEMTVAEIKAELERLEIEIPSGVTKKADLKALLDMAAEETADPGE